MKKTIAFGIMVVCICLMYLFPHSTISPGELVEDHQNLNKKCLSCHVPFKGISNEKCIACHKLSDIGKGTLKSNSEILNQKVLFHENLADQKCTACHTDHKGRIPQQSISGFKHELLSETVIGNCNSCHNKPVDSLHALLSSTCKDCHNTSDWKSDINFNHNKILGTGKNNCTSCHKRPSDDFHSFITDNCDRCHSVSQWKPATFDHSEFFILDKDHNIECSTCHVRNNFKTYSCFGCHEHNQNKILQEHREEGIFNISDCVSCHKSGDEHDIRMRNGSNERMDKNEINRVRSSIRSDEKEKKKNGGRKNDDDND